MGQHTRAAPRLKTFLDDGVAVNACAPLVGLQYRVQHTQGCRLAGAIGSEQAGDLAVGGFEADAAQGMHVTERLVNIVYFDHGCGPAKSRKKGMTKLDW